ncbi:MAG TPA: SDR family NAD(P)-dependent oxidoreductase [Caldithrix abyssi]|uniref:SDR family NAD(P)-dependent oxidoreductase n=1 Tax=Caldithrix abyssi TaxID=187145 RepID=A0A7V5RN90_CALAY|nr:SDR family NAD(P)-dependent oxidoreductase [Caldithrix abyssi]
MKKTALLTGAGGSLGGAVLRELKQKNYHVFAAVRSQGRIIADDLCTPAIVDLSDEAQSADFVQRGLDLLGRFDAAVLTVGGFAMAPLEETSATDIEKMIRINFYSAWHIIRPLFAAMKKQGSGRIVLIGARPGLEPASGGAMAAYTLSKSLLITLSEILNAEGREAGIVTSVVIPSVIDTPANRRAMPDADFTRWVSPQSLAGVISFALESPDLREPLFKVYGDL